MATFFAKLKLLKEEQKAFNTETSKELKDLRLRRGLKASWVAGQLNMVKSRMYRLEDGTINWDEETRDAYLTVIGGPRRPEEMPKEKAVKQEAVA